MRPVTPSPATLLAGVKVLDLSTGVTGPYCTQLLGALGADVWRPDDAASDPVAVMVPDGVAPDPATPSAVYRHLNGRKRPFAIDDPDQRAAAVAGADLVVGDETPGSRRDLLAACRGRVPVLVVTPWGSDGPWAGRPASELVLQAACGSIYPRGRAGEEPLAAGGDLGAWSSGTCALVAALAVLRQAQRTGTPVEADVSAFEAMSIVLNGYTPLKKQLGGRGWPLTRGVEHPSIVPAADGHLVVTTNTRQQFDDLLVLIERGDLLGDEELADARGREARRDEFDAAVASWMERHPRDEVLALADAFRIPAAIVADGQEALAFEQFVERGVFGASADGSFVEPRAPYLVHPRAEVPAPSQPGESEPERPTGAGDLPLAGTRVLDFTAWWSGPSATQVLAALGADVVKVESPARFDGVRTSQTALLPPADGWWETSCLYHFANVNKRSLTVDLRSQAGKDLVRSLIPHCDLVIENFSVRVFDQFGLTWDLVQELNPRASFIRMPAFGLSGPWRDRTAFSQTIESISGLAHVTGAGDGPPLLVRGACDPVAGLVAAAAFLAALHERDASGRGSFAEVTMAEAALGVAAPLTVNASAYGVSEARRGNRSATAAPQGVYRCAGPDDWVALTVADDAQWAALCAAIGLEPGELGDPRGAAARRAAHDQIDARIAAWAAGRKADDVVATLVEAGIAAAAVAPAADVVRNPQLRARGFVEEYEHPMVGRLETLGLPFRLSGSERRWVRSAPPTLGQHNDEILSTLLRLDETAIQRLRDDHVISERPTT